MFSSPSAHLAKVKVKCFKQEQTFFLKLSRAAKSKSKSKSLFFFSKWTPADLLFPWTNAYSICLQLIENSFLFKTFSLLLIQLTCLSRTILFSPIVSLEHSYTFPNHQKYSFDSILFTTFTLNIEWNSIFIDNNKLWNVWMNQLERCKTHIELHLYKQVGEISHFLNR